MRIRSFQPKDIDAVVALLNRCMSRDPITSEIFQCKVLLDHNFDLRGTALAESHGEIVGFALGIVRRFKLEDAAPDFDRSWITLLAIDERFRRQGVAAALVRLLETYFTDSGCKITYVSSYAPNYFIPGVDVDAYPEALEFFKAQGFEEVYRPLSMDADLVKLETPHWVNGKQRALGSEGVIIEPLRPELILPVLDFLRQEFPGDWQRFARETMTQISLGIYRPDNLWVASERGAVIGYAQHDNTGRFGPFGVSKGERGRGVGAVLLFACLRAMRAKGLHNAWFLWTDDKVARLYFQAGFTESRRFAVLKKEHGQLTR